MWDAREKPEVHKSSLVELTKNALHANDERLYRRKLNVRTEEFCYVPGVRSNEPWSYSEQEFQENIVKKIPGGV